MTMTTQSNTDEEIRILRRHLLRDAELAYRELENGLPQRWIDSKFWKPYTEGELAHSVYLTFSDSELLDILTLAAEELGRAPSQHEVFCVYRLFIRRRFGNWPKALTAAGLRPSKAEKEEEKRRKRIERERRKKQQERQFRQQSKSI